MADDERVAEVREEATDLMRHNAKLCRSLLCHLGVHVCRCLRAVGVVENGDHQLHRNAGGQHRHARPRHCALLVKRAVREGVLWRHHVAAEVASQPRPACLLLRRLQWRAAVPHHDECVKAQRRVDAELSVSATQHRRQPSRLSRVCQEEDHVVRLHQPLQPLHVRPHLLHFAVRHRVTRHWNRQHHALRVDAGVDGLERGGGGDALDLAAVLAVFEVEEGLAHGVGVGDAAVVHEGDVAHAPADERARDVAAECARAHQQAARLRNALQLQRRHQPPLHELEVEGGLGLGHGAGVHGGVEVHEAGAEASASVTLPSHGLGHLLARHVVHGQDHVDDKARREGSSLLLAEEQQRDPLPTQLCSLLDGEEHEEVPRRPASRLLLAAGVCHGNKGGIRPVNVSRKVLIPCRERADGNVLCLSPPHEEERRPPLSLPPVCFSATLRESIESVAD
mmetsp:Transcript_8260/g.34691  ORF Transcript_8260/g.34691 Transcript_8260/m.34691 type:complete len:451 (-) Transcript_8260:549-1901(-)